LTLIPVPERVARQRSSDQRYGASGLGKGLGDDTRFTARGPDCVDVAWCGRQRLQDDLFGDVWAPVAIDGRNDFEPRVLLESGGDAIRLDDGASFRLIEVATRGEAQG